MGYKKEFYSRKEFEKFAREQGETSIRFYFESFLTCENSHIVGYRIRLHEAEFYLENRNLKAPNLPEFIDFFNIKDLIEIIKDEAVNESDIYYSINPVDVWKINEYGHLEIFEWEREHCVLAENYKDRLDRSGHNIGLIKLLGENEYKYLPKSFYKYSLNPALGVMECSLTESAKKYIETNDTVYIPQPLLKYDSMKVSSIQWLFQDVDFTGKKVDFREFNLSYFDYINGLFNKTKIDTLNVASFNLKPNCEVVKSLFEGLECDVLDFSDYKFAGIKKLDPNCFYAMKVKKLKATNCDISEVTIECEQTLGNWIGNVYQNSQHRADEIIISHIDEFDAEFYSKMSLEKNPLNYWRVAGPAEFQFDQSSWFTNFHCKKIVNLNKMHLNLKGHKNNLTNVFAGLVVEELDLRKLKVTLDKNDDTSLLTRNMLEHLHCKKIIIDEKLCKSLDTTISQLILDYNGYIERQNKKCFDSNDMWYSVLKIETENIKNKHGKNIAIAINKSSKIIDRTKK